MKKFLSKLLILFVIAAPLLAPWSVQQKSNHITFQKNIAYAEKFSDGHVGYMDCSFGDLGCHMVNFVQLILVGGGNVVVGLSALMLDFFLDHSIQSSSYSDTDFIKKGWEILRDLTNIVFVFALLYVAFNLVLGNDSGDIKKRLINIILIALTINFSLFMVFAIIDTSNIFAHIFYNKIAKTEATYSDVSTTQNAAGNVNDNTTDIQYTGNIKEKSVSLSIAEKINPQQLLLMENIQTKGQRLVIVIIVGAINIALIFTFLSVSFLFLGRTVGLWLAAVLSPLAFASLTIKKMEGLKYIGFEKWFKSLVSMAFMAPVFLFFLYLAVEFMNIGILSTRTGTSFLDVILGVTIPAAAIIIIILQSKTVANDMAGDFAGVIAGFVAKGAMLVGGAALGAGAFAARSSLGALGARAMKSEKFKAFAAKHGKTGGWAMRRMDSLQTSSFDFRNTKANKLLSQHTNMKFGGWMQTEKGKKQWREEKAAKKDERAKKFDTWLSTKEDSHVRDKYGNKAYGIKSYNQRYTQEEVDAWKKANPGKTPPFKVNEVKDFNDYTVKRQKDIENEITKNETEVQTLQEKRTTARQYVQDLKNKGYDKAAAGSPQEQEYQKAISNVDNLTKEINSLNTTISGLKRDMTDKDGRDTYEIQGRKVVVTGHTTQRRSDENIARREKQSGEGVRRTGAAIGASIGAMILPIGGSALGGLVGGALADKIAKSDRVRNWLSKKRNDLRGEQRALKGARYQKEKQNK